ncbi:MAG: filamentous hemagglutinin N-terminal domain-containing protein, partial [Pseudomonadales bacterium]|nr:filamentous hemagglutinin N-terminal domain-containing protein [Pseudomonadales bacterium]
MYYFPGLSVVHLPSWIVRFLLCPLLVINLFALSVQAAPLGGQIVGGSGGINQAGLHTTIQQSSSSLAIDWQSFNINSDERVQFIQPNKHAIVLNRILGNSASQIFGRLDANGQVVLVNPNGLFFGESAVINVGGLLASGLAISADDFLNGDYVFAEMDGRDGAVINQGIIQAATGGSVSLLGRRVENKGFIAAHLGAVNLVAAKEAVLSFDHDGLMGIKVNKAILQDELGLNPALLNAGTIKAEGGRVLLTASVSRGVFSGAVNNGRLQATTSVVVNDDGSFTLGAGADVVNSGEINVSSSAGLGAGQVVLLGENITHSGHIHANTVDGQAGSIELQARDTLLQEGAGVTSARAELSGKGGDIKLLGNKVGLLAQSVADASGASGGGAVLIGGDREGQNILVPNSEFIFIGAESHVYADALLEGDGGKIITFAEDTARIYGGLFARGGVEGGNGGFIETSGLKGFEILAAPDVSAYMGAGGVWLIDPNDILITSNNSETNIKEGFDKDLNADVFKSTGDGARIGVDLIVEALDDNSTVMIKTSTSGVNGELGNITFIEGLDYSGIGESTLILDAANNIILADGKKIHDDSISSFYSSSHSDSIDKLNIEFIAGGSVVLGSESSIATQGGDFTVTSAGFSSLGTVNTSGVERTLSGEEINPGGDITINTTGDLITGTLISTGGVARNSIGQKAGAITLTSGTNINVSGAISALGSNAEKSSSRGFVGGAGNAVTLTAAGDVILLQEIDVSGGAGDQKSGSTPQNGGDAGNIIISGAAISLGANLTAKGGSSENGEDGKGGNITFSGFSTLTSNVEINTSGNTAGDITFSNEILGTTPSSESLTLTGKNINLLGNIGTSSISLGDLTIISTGDVTATNSQLFVKSLNIDSALNVAVNSISTNTVDVGAGNIIINFTKNFENTGSISALASGTGGNGNIQITGNGSNNIFTIGSDISGGGVALNGNGGNDTFNLAANITGKTSASVSGGSGNDTFNIQAPALSLNIDGGNDSDTLVGANVDNQWDILGASSGALYQSDTPSSKITFSNLETLQGGTAADVFALGANGEIGKLIGGKGSNSLQARNADNTWEITAENAGKVDYVGSFSQIQTLIGGSEKDDFFLSATGAITTAIYGGLGTNRLQARDVSNVWNITGIDSGNVSNVAAFFKIAELYGNEGKDDFFLMPGGSISRFIDGAGGANSLTADNVQNTWAITGKNSGSVGSAVVFENIQTLVGGSEADHFILSGSGEVTGAFQGKGGANSLKARDADNIWLINKLNGGSLNGVSFSDIQTLVGGNVYDKFSLGGSGSIFTLIDGGGGLNSLEALGKSNIWLVNEKDAGSINGVTPFSQIQTLLGSSFNDDFTLSESGSISGKIVGGAGDNSLTGRDVLTTWNITGDNAGSSADVIAFRDIHTLIGGDQADNFIVENTGSISAVVGGAGLNSLKGRDSGDTWTITGSEAGFTTSVSEFSTIQTLKGGMGDDVFRLTKVGDISGSIEGGGGQNSLQARDVINVWNITAANTGVVDHVAAFSGIQTLIGGTNNDTFTLSASGPVITAINGGGGAGLNTLVAKVDQDNAWNITRTDGGSVNGVASFDGIQTLQGGNLADNFTLSESGSITGKIIGGSGANSLTGRDVSTRWNITGVNTGSSTDVIVFRDIQTLTGGDQADNFIVENTGSISTLINGGGGNNRLQALGLDNSWNITSDNAGSVNGVPVFRNIQTLVGGDGADDFIIGGLGKVAGGIQGGAGDNSLQGRNTANTWTITDSNTGNVINVTDVMAFEDIQTLKGGTGNDTFFLKGAGAISGGIEGGTGQNSLQSRNENNTWSITGENSGEVNHVASFSDIQTLIGGSANDKFSLDLHGAISTAIQGGGGVNTLFARDQYVNAWLIDRVDGGSVDGVKAFENIQILRGGSLADEFRLSENGSVSGKIVGGIGANCLIGRDALTDWLIDGVDAGSSDDVASFSDIQTLIGGANVDWFKLETAGFISTLIDGGDGLNSLQAGNSGNTWNITGSNIGSMDDVNAFSQIQTLMGGSGVDDFIMTADGEITGEIQGGLGSNSLKREGAINTWSIIGRNKGLINGVTAFSAIQTLKGGTGDDAFILDSSGEISGGIEGGLGANKLQARDENNRWNISAENAGKVDNVNAFLEIQTLVGGSKDDVFILGSNGAVSTAIQGHAGANSLQARDVTNTWNISGSNSGNVTHVGAFSGIQTLVGGSGIDDFILSGSGGVSDVIHGNGGANSLQARDDVANTWNITDSNTGNVTNVAAFDGIQTLIGGAGNDRFLLGPTGSIFTLINGGA